MSGLSSVLPRLLEASPLSILVGRLTILLLCGWLARGLLARANPKWRVNLWRTIAIGLAAVVILSAGPPLITFQVNGLDGASSLETFAEISESNQPPNPMRPGPTRELPIQSSDFRAMNRGTEIVTLRTKPSEPIPARGRVEPSPSATMTAIHSWIRAIQASGLERRLIVVWLAGVFVLAARLAVSARALSALVGRSSDAPESIQRECERLAAELGVGSVRALITSEVATPCLAGVRHPVILLPEAPIEADLRAILAHELSHAKGHDLLWNSLLHVFSILLWFHPLAWRIRGNHATACDAVCDALAADLLGDVDGYSRTLARLALKISGQFHVQAQGLAMAGRSDVRRRIESLQRKVYHAPLSRRFFMPAIFGVGLLVMAIGSVGLTAAPAQDVAASKKEAHTKNPTLTISGEVTDADTGKPLKEFKVAWGLSGPDRIHWSDESTVYENGKYQIKFYDTKSTFYLRATASDHEVAKSRAFKADEGEVNFSFALKRLEETEGIAVDLNGKPVDGVHIGIATRQLNFGPDPDNFVVKAANLAMKTGPDGRFKYVKVKDRHKIIAVTIGGFGEVFSDEFAKTGKVVIKPLGRLEGKVLIGKEPAAGASVSFSLNRRELNQGNFVIEQVQQTVTDQDGRFVFDKVIPGPGTASYSLITDFPNGGGQGMPMHQEPVEIVSGQTSVVTIGGKGRPVVGRVVVKETPESPIDWQMSSPAVIQVPRGPYGDHPANWKQLAANIDQDGRFRIEDVTPGDYEFSVRLKTDTEAKFPRSRTYPGEAKLKFTLPRGDEERPFDLGEIEGKLFPILKVGDMALEFTSQRFDGKPFRFSDHLGKIVLLHFWGDNSRNKAGDVPLMKEIQSKFGKYERFAMFGMGMDSSTELLKNHAKADGLDWPQLFASDDEGGIGERYSTGRYPAWFLIGPDGRILAKSLEGPALKEAIQKALLDKKSLQAVKTTILPPRIPVTRYDIRSETKPFTERPALVVLDDSEEDFDPSKPHHDGLRFLDADGRTLRTLKEFNLCGTGPGHKPAIDRERGRIYINEPPENRITALNLFGQRLWRLDGIESNCQAVDPGTGNLWVGGSDETILFDPDGKEIASYPISASDLVFDSKTDSFWLVGNGIVKMSREGEIRFQKARKTWQWSAVGVNRNDGGVWIAERDHRDVEESENRIMHLDSEGNLIFARSIGEDKNPFDVECDPRSGTTYVNDFRKSILRFNSDNQELPPFPIEAVAIAVSPTTGQIWATTKTEILRLDASGKILGRTPLGADSDQSWLAAF